MTTVALHIDQLFFQAPGGIGTYIRELVPALSRRDPALELKLFHARFPEHGPHERWVRDFWVQELPHSIKRLYPQWDLFARPPLPPGLAGADVLHAPLPAAIPPAGHNQKLVVTVHDLAFEHFPRLFPREWRVLFKLGLRAAARRADAILTPSRNTAEDVLELTTTDPSKIHVVPLAASLHEVNGDVDAHLDRLKIPRPYVLFVGTLEPRKNLVRLVRAYRRVAAAGGPHALVLAGPLGWHAEALLRELALEGPGEVLLTGSVGPISLDALYRGADCFAYPSLYEGFGLPVLEALARGVPTVAADGSSLPEVFGDAAVGIDPTSVRQLAEAIERVLGDRSLAARLRERGPARAERFSWDDTARRTLEVYDLVLGRK